MRPLLFVVAIVAAVLLNEGLSSERSTPASAATSESAASFVVAPEVNHLRPCTQVRFRSYARRVYRRDRISIRAVRSLDRRRACALSGGAARNMLVFQRQLSGERKARREMMAVTPFAGPNGTRWAIPYAVVSCESGGSWSSYNSSGARGPYQLLSHGEPWPANTPAARLAHHRIARQLYLSHGLRDWSPSQGCWGGRT